MGHNPLDNQEMQVFRETRATIIGTTGAWDYVLTVPTGVRARVYRISLTSSETTAGNIGTTSATATLVFGSTTIMARSIYCPAVGVPSGGFCNPVDFGIPEGCYLQAEPGEDVQLEIANDWANDMTDVTVMIMYQLDKAG